MTRDESLLGYLEANSLSNPECTCSLARGEDKTLSVTLCVFGITHWSTSQHASRDCRRCILSNLGRISSFGWLSEMVGSAASAVENRSGKLEDRTIPLCFQTCACVFIRPRAKTLPVSSSCANRVRIHMNGFAETPLWTENR